MANSGIVRLLKKKNINITVATCIKGAGGISTVLTVLNESGFFKSTYTKFIASHKQGRFGGAGLAINLLLSVIKTFYFLIFYNVDIVHVHMASRGSYSRKSIIVRIAKKFGANVIIHLHGAEFREFYSKESSRNKQKHIRETFNLADRVIVLSSQWKKWVCLIVDDSSKVRVVYNAVPQLTFPKKRECRDIILFLGRLSERKGVGDLISAFSQLASKYPNVELHLGGDGDLNFYKKIVGKLNLSERVRFLGWVSGDQKNRCLANAAVYCLPSYNEGFPMGVLEAMSAGVAVVASTAGGIPDAITDKREGLLIEAGDVSALAIALTTMLEDTKSRAMYVAAANAKFKANFSTEVIIPQLKGIYEELLRAKPQCAR